MSKLLGNMLINQLTNNNYHLLIRTCKQLTDCNNVYKQSKHYQCYKNVLKREGGLSNQKALEELDNNRYLLNIPLKDLTEKLSLCKAHKIALNDFPINWKFLDLNQKDLNNNIEFLKEMGAKRINTTMIISLAKRASMITFKLFSGISEDENVAENLYSYLHNPPPDIQPLGKIDENLPVIKYREKILRHYVQWRFQLPHYDDKTVDCLVKRLQSKSFNNIKNMFDLLHYQLKTPIELMRDYTNLGEVSVKDLKRILNKIQVICHVPLIELIKIDSELLQMKFNNTNKLKILLEKYKISKKQLKLCPKILLIDSEILRFDLKLALNTQQLAVFQDHPNFLHIFMIKDSLQGRIEYLNYLNIHDTTVQILKQRSKLFEKNIKNLIPRTKNQEMIGMFERLLKMDPQLIKQNLDKHSLWQKVSFVTIHQTYKYLQDVVDDKALKDNMQLLLYHVKKVKSTLAPMIKKNNLMSPENRYSNSQLLALCAYKIEKQYHFTGDGIWDVGDHAQIDESNHDDVNLFEKSKAEEEAEIFNKVKEIHYTNCIV